MKSVLIVLFIMLVTLILLATAHAHSFYSIECCAEKDCRPVPCSEIVNTPTGWTWKDRNFTTAMLRLSPDGLCHVCFGLVPRCLYLPPQS